MEQKSEQIRTQHSPRRPSLNTLKTLNKTLGGMSIIGWLFFIVALYMFHYSSPDPRNLYDDVLANQTSTLWNVAYTDLFMVFMSIGIGITLAALALNIYLYRARRTHIWVNLLLLIASSIGIMIYFQRVFAN